MHTYLFLVSFVSRFRRNWGKTDKSQMAKDVDLATRSPFKLKQLFERQRPQDQRTVWMKANRFVCLLTRSCTDSPRHGQCVTLMTMPDYTWLYWRGFCPVQHHQVVNKVSILQARVVLHGSISMQHLQQLLTHVVLWTARRLNWQMLKLCKLWLMDLVVRKNWLNYNWVACKLNEILGDLTNWIKVYIHSSTWWSDWMEAEIFAGTYSTSRWQRGRVDFATYEVSQSASSNAARPGISAHFLNCVQIERSLKVK